MVIWIFLPQLVTLPMVNTRFWMFRQNLKICPCQKIDFTRFITFCPIMKVYALKALSIPEKSWRLLLVDVSTSTTNFVATISLIQSCTVQEITISSLQRSSAAPSCFFYYKITRKRTEHNMSHLFSMLIKFYILTKLFYYFYKYYFLLQQNYKNETKTQHVTNYYLIKFNIWEHYIKVSKFDYAFYLIDSFQFVA